MNCSVALAVFSVLAVSNSVWADLNGNATVTTAVSARKMEVVGAPIQWSGGRPIQSCAIEQVSVEHVDEELSECLERQVNAVDFALWSLRRSGQFASFSNVKINVHVDLIDNRALDPFVCPAEVELISWSDISTRAAVNGSQVKLKATFDKTPRSPALGSGCRLVDPYLLEIAIQEAFFNGKAARLTKAALESLEQMPVAKQLIGEARRVADSVARATAKQARAQKFDENAEEKNYPASGTKLF